MGDDWDAEDFDVDKGFADESKEEEEEDLALAEVNVPEPQPKPKQQEAVKPQKSKQERIEEKKAQRRAMEKAEGKDTEEASTLSAAEERRKREELQKASDLRLTMETFGAAGGPTIESMEPTSEDEFAKFKDALADKITQFDTSKHYRLFMEQLIIKCCSTLDTGDLRHLSTVLSTMATEKQKAKSVKTAGKKKGKASLSSIGKGSKRLNELDYDNELGAEFDDFM